MRHCAARLQTEILPPIKRLKNVAAIRPLIGLDAELREDMPVCKPTNTFVSPSVVHSACRASLLVVACCSRFLDTSFLLLLAPRPDLH